LIQTALFFVLGFLTAGFLALMIAPAIWNRAVRLTRRRIEANVPLTMADIQADKDRLRAEFAISTRRLELGVKEQREKSAAQLLELNRRRDEAKAMTKERDEAAARLAEVEAEHRKLRAEFEERERQLALVADRLAETSATLEVKSAELDKLERLFEDASFSSSSRQIELVARESEVDRLKDNLKKQRTDRKEADRQLREATAENHSLREELRLERQRLDHLEAEIAALRQRPEPLLAAPAADEAETAALRARAEGLLRENEKLRDQIRKQSGGAGDADMLRDQIGDLAAEVVHLTALMDGEDSPIRRLVAASDDPEAGEPSLAGRIRALQKAAARQ
jgi:myosin heavy subunit